MRAFTKNVIKWGMPVIGWYALDLPPHFLMSSEVIEHCTQGLCSTAVVSICGDGLTPGIYQKSSPTRVDPGSIVPQMHSKRWWNSSVAGNRVNPRNK
jgi:hypothetical protein